MPKTRLAIVAMILGLTGAEVQAAPDGSEKPACELGLPLSVQTDWQMHFKRCVSANFTPLFEPAEGAEEPQARLLITITPDGQVTKLEIDQSSGIPVFDQASRAAVLRAAPFQPFTPDMPQEPQTLSLNLLGR